MGMVVRSTLFVVTVLITPNEKGIHLVLHQDLPWSSATGHYSIQVETSTNPRSTND